MSEDNYPNKLDDTSAFTSYSAEEPDPIIIKAVGVGGGGNNAVNHMFKQDIPQVSYVNINTDRQALKNSLVPNKLQIGNGLGAGNKPEVARAFAEDSAEEIGRLFDDETKMVFITAGMGGGTGTGAAPVVARIARERGLLTIGIVTIPFLFEGQAKIKKAIAGADEMAQYVDALLVINNERLTEIYGDFNFLNAFGKADDTLSIAARSISEIITSDGLINLDFNDVDSTLRNGGAAIISTGYGEGEGRVSAAINDALNSPLLKNRDILGSKKLLFNIFFNPDAEEEFLMSETAELTSFISSINSEVDVVWGVGFDRTLGNGVKITILAAGFDVTIRDEEDDLIRQQAQGAARKSPFDFGRRTEAGASQPRQGGAHERQPSQAVHTPQSQQTPVTKPSTPASRVSDERIAEEYGANKLQDLTGSKDRGSMIVLGLNQLDDDNVCDTIDRYPTYKRDRKIVESVHNGAYDTGTRPAQPSTGQTFCY